MLYSKGNILHWDFYAEDSVVKSTQVKLEWNECKPHT